MPATRLPHVRFAAQGDHPAVEVPAIGQGTWYMGEGLAPHRDEVRALQEGLELGLSLIDTAEMYGEGGAESVVGEALAGRREQAFLVSKVYPWNAGRESAIEACERSLKRLDTDHLDLYLLHWPGEIPLEETLEAFTRLQEQGKILRFGVSNFDVDDMQALLAQPGGAACVTDQVLYHLGSRGIETHLYPWLHERGLPMMAYCPLAQGGRLRNELMSHPEVLDIAAELGITPAQLLLAWAIRPHAGQHEVIAIPKAVQREHVSQNARALEIRLDDDALARLDAAFPPPIHKVPLDIV
ncbi:aldo/keto reductase [Litchfieldella xinjiangensis]|uniref:aldo/keto reductase n=1 Tax=Litchfieldella xinjiangensis TaxID=1166948 RepID=UPI0005B8E209|nr:aldo/keto reductase [Halomonas xinjiangensis]